MTDHITLAGLRARGFHGVLPQERLDGQDFVVDVSLEVDTRAAATSDALADTVDYAAVADSLIAVITGEPVQLIETLAERLAQAALSDERVRSARVTVHKPDAPIPHPFADVAVTVVRP